MGKPISSDATVCQGGNPSRPVEPPALDALHLVSAVGEARSDSLLHLNNNISDETPSPSTTNLSPYHKKSAYTLANNVQRFCDLYGIENCAFLTLTFPDNVTDHREASRRFNNMNRRYLSVHYGEWIWARERQDRGAWHFHIIIQCKGDIRTGFDWDEYLAWIKDYKSGKRRRLKTGNTLLRSLWEMNRRAFANYGFGRSEILPIRSTAEAVANYVGEYISKQIGQRPEEDKGVRLTSHSAGFAASTPKFSWNTDGGKMWRSNVRLLALFLKCGDIDDISEKLGPGWPYRYKDAILDVREVLDSLPPAPF